MLVIAFGESDIIMNCVSFGDELGLSGAFLDFLLGKFKENKPSILNFIFLDCSWFAKEFKVTLASGGSICP